MAYTIGVVESINLYDSWLTNDTIYTVVTSGALPLEIYRYTPKLSEKGYVEFYYVAVDNVGAGIVRKKVGQYRKANTGTVTGGLSAQTTPTADTGMGTCDFGILVSGQDITITVTGIAAKDIRHSLEIVRNSIALDEP